MIEHLLSQLLSRKVDKSVDGWVDAGRTNLPVGDGERFSLRFSNRYRAQAILTAAIFAIFSALATWCHFFSEPLGFWLGLAYLGFILPMTLVSIGCAVHAFSHRIILSKAGLVTKRFGLQDVESTWDSVTSVRRSHLTAPIIVDDHFGNRIRVSTQLDGLYAFAELVSLTPPNTRDTSIVNWMIEEL